MLDRFGKKLCSVREWDVLFFGSRSVNGGKSYSSLGNESFNEIRVQKTQNFR